MAPDLGVDAFNLCGGAIVEDFALFVNPGHGNRFLHVRLVGTTSTRTAVGARIRVELETANGVREIHRAVGSVSSFGVSRFDLKTVNASAFT